MSEPNRPELHLDEKWDRVINVVFSRSTMGLLAGTVAGFLLFRMFHLKFCTCFLFHLFGALAHVLPVVSVCFMVYLSLLAVKLRSSEPGPRCHGIHRCIPAAVIIS